MEAQDEARITISGVLLDQGQSMTLRVAIEAFRMDMVPGKLGEDEIGMSIAASYSKRAGEISSLIHNRGNK